VLVAALAWLEDCAENFCRLKFRSRTGYLWAEKNTRNIPISVQVRYECNLRIKNRSRIRSHCVRYLYQKLCGVLELSYPALSSKRCHFYAKRSLVVNWQLDNTTPPTTICTVWKKGLGTIGGARPSGAAATVKERVIIKLNMGPKHAKTLVSIHVSNGRRIFEKKNQIAAQCAPV
jgi:hypothetical protein